jgi:hypothetical protein
MPLADTANFSDCIFTSCGKSKRRVLQPRRRFAKGVKMPVGKSGRLVDLRPTVVD